MTSLPMDALIALAEAFAERIAARISATLPVVRAADRRLSVEEARAVLGGCTARHVRQLVRAGKLPAARDGRRLLIKETDLERYLAAPAKAEGRTVDELFEARARRKARP